MRRLCSLSDLITLILAEMYVFTFACISEYIHSWEFVAPRRLKAIC